MIQNLNITGSGSNWAPYIQAAVALAVGLFAAVFAYWQWRTNTTKLRFELLQERLKIFRECRDFIKDLAQNGRIERARRIQIYILSLEVEFIFNEAISNFIMELGESGEDAEISQPMSREQRELLLDWGATTGETMMKAMRSFMRLDKLFWSRRDQRRPISPKIWPFPKNEMTDTNKR